MSVEITEGKPVRLYLPTPVTLRSPDAPQPAESHSAGYFLSLPAVKSIKWQRKNENIRVWTNSENLFFLLHFFLPFLKEVEIVLSVVMKPTHSEYTRNSCRGLKYPS